MKVIWESRALDDLRRIQRYIARDNPAAAHRWVRQLTQRAYAASAHPLAGRPVPELGQVDVREVFSKGYSIIYRVTDSAIQVLTVFEGHRLLPDEVLPPDGE